MDTVNSLSLFFNGFRQIFTRYHYQLTHFSNAPIMLFIVPRPRKYEFPTSDCSTNHLMIQDDTTYVSREQRHMAYDMRRRTRGINP